MTILGMKKIANKVAFAAIVLLAAQVPANSNATTLVSDFSGAGMGIDSTALDTILTIQGQDPHPHLTDDDLKRKIDEARKAKDCAEEINLQQVRVNRAQKAVDEALAAVQKNNRERDKKHRRMLEIQRELRDEPMTDETRKELEAELSTIAIREIPKLDTQNRNLVRAFNDANLKLIAAKKDLAETKARCDAQTAGQK